MTAGICINICDRYACRSLSHWFNLGLKKCNNCEMAFEPKYKRCPCCNSRLKCRTRTSPAFPVRYVE